MQWVRIIKKKIKKKKLFPLTPKLQLQNYCLRKSKPS